MKDFEMKVDNASDHILTVRLDTFENTLKISVLISLKT